MKGYRLATIVIIGIAANIIVRGQADPFLSDLQSIPKLVTSVENRWIIGAKAKADADSIKVHAAIVLEAYKSHGKKEVSQSYRETLSPYLTILNEYARGKGGQADSKLLSGLQDLEEELRAKVVFGRSLKGAFFSDIEVVVETNVGGKPMSGYEVWYVPKGWRGYEERYRRFDNLSTPAVKSLAPGNYFIWAQKGSYRSSLYPFSFGFDELTKRRIDLEVR